MIIEALDSDVIADEQFRIGMSDMQEILPDKVLRGMSYMEQAAMDNYEPALDFLNSNKLK